MNKELIEKVKRGEFLSEQEIKDYSVLASTCCHNTNVKMWDYISSNKQNLLNLHRYASMLIGCPDINWYKQQE